MTVPRITKLDEKVINRIAAGEVVQRPSSALKELMENCLDAGSTKITVTLNGGGLKVLQIVDNGHGINKEDFPIVCKRFTTSKLQKFADLKSIATFGFRGEALASISHVAHLTITSKTKDSPIGYTATFIDGVMQEKTPKPTAAVKGTTIFVENLFYNTPLRKNALSRPQEEYKRCVRVMERYSIQFAGVEFVCKRAGSNKVDLRTQLRASQKDNVRAHFGKKISNELIDMKKEDAPTESKLSGLVTNANYSMKRTIFILFVNNRLVDHSGIKRGVEAVYSPLLPKHGHPWVFLNLTVPSNRIDVNVHPSKMEVQFLEEEEIIKFITDCVQESLEKYNSSRAFYGIKKAPEKAPVLDPINPKKRKATHENNDPLRPQKMIRTDASMQVGAIRRFFPSAKPKAPGGGSSKRFFSLLSGSRCECHPNSAVGCTAVNGGPGAAQQSPTAKATQPVKRMIQRAVSKPDLDSVEKLRADVQRGANSTLRACLSKAVYVGCVDLSRFCFQYNTRLLLADFKTLSHHFFYQTVLNHFSDFPKLKLKTPLSIKELVAVAVNDQKFGWKPEFGSKASVIATVDGRLCDMKEMLEEYFSIAISDEGKLVSLPNLIDGYVPNMGRLPAFLLRLGTEVEWEDEEACFQGVAKELALLFRIDGDDEEKVHNDVWKIFPYLTTDRFQPPSSCEVLELTRLEKLYRVFERC